MPHRPPTLTDEEAFEAGLWFDGAPLASDAGSDPGLSEPFEVLVWEERGPLFGFALFPLFGDGFPIALHTQRFQTVAIQNRSA